MCQHTQSFLCFKHKVFYMRLQRDKYQFVSAPKKFDISASTGITTAAEKREHSSLVPLPIEITKGTKL